MSKDEEDTRMARELMPSVHQWEWYEEWGKISESNNYKTSTIAAAADSGYVSIHLHSWRNVGTTHAEHSISTEVPIDMVLKLIEQYIMRSGDREDNSANVPPSGHAAKFKVLEKAGIVLEKARREFWDALGKYQEWSR